jgi:hypothetical protein
MFQRFTQPARQAVVLAQEEARELGHDYIGTEHIVLGLLREQEGLAARVLAELDVTLDAARHRVRQVVGVGEHERSASGQIPFTGRAKKVLELALRESMSLGHDYIGSEHILLGVARLNEGVGSEVLRDLGADAETIRAEVVRVLAGPGKGYVRSVENEPDERLLARLDDSATRALRTARERSAGLLLVPVVLVALQEADPEGILGALGTEPLAARRASVHEVPLPLVLRRAAIEAWLAGSERISPLHLLVGLLLADPNAATNAGIDVDRALASARGQLGT